MPGVSANIYTPLFSTFDRLIHHQWVASVPGAGDIGRRYLTHQRFVHTERVPSETFTHIAVKINFHCPFHSSSRTSWTDPRRPPNVARYFCWAASTLVLL